MSLSAKRDEEKIVSIRALQQPAEAVAAGRAVVEVRRQLSLLQGYADLMEGLSPRQTVEILKVMGDKIRDLTVALRPFILERTSTALELDDYRAIRARQRELLIDYRFLLSQLRKNLADSGPRTRSAGSLRRLPAGHKRIS